MPINCKQFGVVYKRITRLQYVHVDAVSSKLKVDSD
jgi:hypothetical protein